MIVTFWKGVFVCDTLDEKGALKKAGFVLHEPTSCNLSRTRCKACRAKIGRRYWSDKVESATRLRAHCNQRALAVMREHLSRLEKSRAVDADITIPAPKGFEYLPYQKAGIAYALQRKDTLIADDPGLGKTIQGLGFINYTKPKNIIVVCPKTVLFNWQDEALKWLIDDYLIWPVKSKSEPVPQRDGLFVIVNYDKLSGKNALTQSLKRVWDVAIFDEAQMIKTPETLRSQAIIGDEGLMRRTHRCLFLSGTPVENRPKEIWPIAAAICPAKFGSWPAFAERYCGAHIEVRTKITTDKITGEERETRREVWVTDGASNLAELQQKMRSSFMVRRLKKDVLTELPPKRRQLLMLEDSKVDWSKHPQFQRWKTLYETEYEENLARLEAAKTEDEYIAAINDLERFTGIAFEEMSEFRHQTAIAKLPLCLAYTEQILESGVENLVIWAHHRDVIEAASEKFKDIAVVVNGQTSDKKRQEAVSLFQAGKKRIFIGQMRAAGTGITLTKASTTLFYEIDWSPGVNTQCEDRLSRIGQRKMVHIIILLLAGTLDANIAKKIVEKQAIIEKMLDQFPDLPLRRRQSRAW